MIKKIYMVVAFIFSANIGIEEKSFEEFGLSLIVFGAFYLFFKIMFGKGKQQVKSSGEFFSWFMSMMDTSKNDKQIINNMWANHNAQAEMNRQARKQQEQESARRRNKAKDDAIFYQNIADANKGTSKGDVAQYKANKAKYGKF